MKCVSMLRSLYIPASYAAYFLPVDLPGRELVQSCLVRFILQCSVATALLICPLAQSCDPLAKLQDAVCWWLSVLLYTLCALLAAVPHGPDGDPTEN